MASSLPWPLNAPLLLPLLLLPACSAQGRQHKGYVAYKQVAILGSTLASAAPPPLPTEAASTTAGAWGAA